MSQHHGLGWQLHAQDCAVHWLGQPDNQALDTYDAARRSAAGLFPRFPGTEPMLPRKLRAARRTGGNRVVEPYGFQKAGAEWLAQQLAGVLADEMGLGKTLQAIRAADLVRATTILVVTPAIARVAWAR